MKRDLKNNLSSRQSLAPAARTASANGSEVSILDDVAVAVEVVVGTVTDGTFTPKLQHRDESSDSWVDCTADELEGSFAALETDTNQLVGYKGTKKNVRAVVTEAGASPAPSTGAVFGVNILSKPDFRPAA